MDVRTNPDCIDMGPLYFGERPFNASEQDATLKAQIDDVVARDHGPTTSTKPSLRLAHAKSWLDGAPADATFEVLAEMTRLDLERLKAEGWQPMPYRMPGHESGITVRDMRWFVSRPAVAVQPLRPYMLVAYDGDGPPPWMDMTFTVVIRPKSNKRAETTAKRKAQQRRVQKRVEARKLAKKARLLARGIAQT